MKRASYWQPWVSQKGLTVRMPLGMTQRQRSRRESAAEPGGSVLIVALLAVVVLLLLAVSLLSLSFSEEFNQRRDRSRLLAFFAAEGGVHEAVARMNLAPGSPTTNEVSLPWPGNPAAVRDPRIVQGDPPDPDPRNYSDSSSATWRFWNYDPSWRYTGTSSGGRGQPADHRAHGVRLL